MAEQDTDPFAKYGGSEVKEPVQSPTSDPFAKYGGVELSKKAGGAGSPPTPTPSINGLNNFQNSPQSISPVIDPELHQKMVNNDVATYQKQQQGLKDAIGAYSQAHNGQPMTTPNTSQKSVQSYQPVPLTTKLQLNARRIGANILTGITEGTVAPANYLNNKLGITDDKETARINDKINSGTGIDLGLPKSYVDNGDGTFGTNAVNGLARILPAIISSEPSYGASFALQGVGNAALKVQDLKNQGIKFNNHSDDLMILGSGLVNYALGKSVSGNVFSKLAPAVQDDITQGLAAEATRDVAKLGTDATTQDIAQAYAKQAQSFATRLGQTGIEAIKSIPAITTDFAGANLANSAIKAGVNKLSGNNPLGNVTGDEIANDVISPIYDGSTPANGDLGQFAKNILGSQVVGLGGLHGLLSGSMLNDNSPYKNPIIESLQNDNSPENIDKVKSAVTQQGMADGLHPDEIEKTHDAIDKVAEIAKTIPKNLPPDKFTNAISAVLKRNQLQEELGNQRGEYADESLKDVKTPYEQLLSDKVDQANDEVKNAVVGGKSTFSKGIGDEEGKFFKTTDGNREEITPSRYELESTERDAKANSPKETTINPIENESSNEINRPIEGQSNIDQESIPESESDQKGNGEQNNPSISESTDANVGREKVSDGDAPTLSELSTNLKEKGNSGISIESATKRDAESGELTDEPLNNGTKHIVSRDKDGKINGALEIGHEIKGNDNTISNRIKQLGDLSTITQNRTDTELSRKLVNIYRSIFGKGEYTGNLSGLRDAANEANSYAADGFLRSLNEPSKSIEILKKHLEDNPENEKELLGKPTSVKVAVAPDSRGQRIVTDLFKHAEDNGIDLSNVRGKEIPISEPVQQSENDTPTGSVQDSGDKSTQSEQTSSRRSSTEKSLENVGLENTDTYTTRSGKLVEAEADKAIKDGYDIDDLIHKIKNDGHIATDTENVILAKHLGAREKEISDINADIRDNGATYSDKKLSDLSDKRDKLLQDFQDSANLTQETRRAAARALNSGNFDVKNNYSLETMILNERKDLGRKLTTEELADVTKTHQMLSDAEIAYQKRIKDLEDENSRLKADKTVRMVATKSRKNLSKVELAEERKVIAQEFSDKLKQMRGSANDAFKASAEFLSAAAPYVAKMVRNLAEEGILDLKDIVKRVKSELGLDDVSDRDITDIIGGKYSKRLTQSETAKRLAQLRAEAKLVSAIQDGEDGLRKLNPARTKVANAKIVVLRQRLAELDKENGLYDAKRLDQTKTRLINEIAKIKNDLATGNFDKPEPTKPVNDATTLTLRRQRDFLRREYDIGQAKKALAQRTLFEKSRDNAMNVASLPRALKAAMDFSAPLRHGLFASVPHPIEGAKAFKTAIGQMFSEKKYNDWMADLKASPQYELMQNSGLYISDKSDPRLLAREEDFMSNLPEKIPIFKHIYKATERNYQGYLNALRTGVFMDAANTLGEQGYTFENNPEKFKGIAKVVNVLTGRGDIPDLLGGKNPVVLSNALFSPRFMGARIHTLYLWADPRLPKEARIMAAKDIGKTVATVASFVTLAKLSGYKVNLNPNRSDFLKIKSKDGKLQYDISGGTSPYITLLSRMLTGKYTNSYGETSNMNNPQYGKPTRLTTSMNFLRGRLSTPVAMGVNLMDKKDMMGNKYGLKQLPEELVPMSMSDIHQAFKAGGITDALKSIIPAELGVGVSPTHPKKEN